MDLSKKNNKTLSSKNCDKNCYYQFLKYVDNKVLVFPNKNIDNCEKRLTLSVLCPHAILVSI